MASIGMTRCLGMARALCERGIVCEQFPSNHVAVLVYKSTIPMYFPVVT